MHDKKLTPEEIAGLKEVGRALSKRLTPAVYESLSEKGLIEQKLGGYVRTPTGNAWLSKHV